MKIHLVTLILKQKQGLSSQKSTGAKLKRKFPVV